METFVEPMDKNKEGYKNSLFPFGMIKFITAYNYQLSRGPHHGMLVNPEMCFLFQQVNFHQELYF
jgi:hypothetical protein